MTVCNTDPYMKFSLQLNQDDAKNEKNISLMTLIYDLFKLDFVSGNINIEILGNKTDVSLVSSHYDNNDIF